jgi:hypothetical protein
MDSIPEGKLMEEIKDRARALLLDHQAATEEKATENFQPLK